RLGVEHVEVTNHWVNDNLKRARTEFDAYVDGLVGTTAPVARLVLATPSNPQSGEPLQSVELRRDAHGHFERVESRG
ncbi:MAG: hypothetical protein H0T65_10080, partial [Deltaproteobacteria bacterium]|nr:hypothetical protein [Deltaproteobacteria bacterium]